MERNDTAAELRRLQAQIAFAAARDGAQPLRVTMLIGGGVFVERSFQALAAVAAGTKSPYPFLGYCPLSAVRNFVGL